MRRMSSAHDDPTSLTNTEPREGRWLGVPLVVSIGILVGLLYLPLLRWLGSVTLHTGQLTNGALLVCFALAICARNAIAQFKLSPRINDWGLGLLCLAVLCLWVAG